MIPVYETKTFKSEARRYGLSSYAANLQEKFMQNPDPNSYFDRRIDEFTWYDIVSKKGHIVGRMKHVPISGSDHPVFCLLRIIDFDSLDRKFIIGKQGKKNVKSLPEHIDKDDLFSFVKNWVDNYEKSDDQESRLPPLPSEYLPWLQPPIWFPASKLDELDMVVYETEKWRKGMPAIYDHWAEIHNLLEPFFWDNPPTDACFNQSDPTSYKISTKTNIVIYCNYYNLLEGFDDRRLLILKSARDRNQCANVKDDQPLDNIKKNINMGGDTWDSETGVVDRLARQAVRAYPGYFLEARSSRKEGNYEKWRVIEKDESANLAMSPEEEALLSRLTKGAGENTSTPAFINGRAGSGKSTVLFYLFAHYWMYSKRLKNALPGIPYFITLSGRLLDSARQTVKSIVEADCRYLADREDFLPVTEGLDDVFLPFRSLLLEILPKSRHSHYSHDREINFDVFRRLFLRENDVRIPAKDSFKGKRSRSCSPELCWHVLRSYIKGFSPKGFMDIGTYRALPEEDRSVEERHFQEVFESVWPWYRSLTVEGEYWDQQDLAREVLTGLRDKDFRLPQRLEKCVAVFCDEAQDLTGVELNLVLHLSVFSRYDLGAVQTLHNIPFAFAGDPMQTLNPSGFRWENLTSSFYRNLLAPLNLHRSVSKSELHYNYRSPRLITNLANLIQFHRRALFREKYLKPQRPWSLSDGERPTRYKIEDSHSLTESEKKSLQDSFFLLPCEEGSESEYAKEKPFLVKLLEMPNPPEIMSVMTAKGLDLKKVVLFGFGQTLFPEGLPQVNDEDTHFTQNIGLAYAFNKLYVAITRSTDELLIMDTEHGHKMLWDQLLNRTRINGILKSMGEDISKQWIEVLPDEGALPVWDSANFFTPLKVADLEAQAKKLESSGMELLRSDFMEKAAAFYRKAMKSEDEKKCKSYALWYSGRFREASKLFQELNMLQEAVECLWQGMDWNGLVAMGGSVNKNRMALSRFMVSNLPPVEQLASFIEELDTLQIETEPPSVPQWREVITELVRVTREAFQQSVGQDRVFYRLAQRLIEFDKIGHQNCLPLAAEGFVLLNEWKEARDVLDKIGPTQKVDSRHLILARTELWPDYIKPCKTKNLGDLLLTRWKDDNKPLSGMSHEGANYLFDTLRENSHTNEAIQVAFSAVLLERLWKIREELSLDDRMKMVNLSISKDRSGLNVEEGIKEIWPRRHELLWKKRLELYELLCTKGDWVRVAELTGEILAESELRQEEFNWICDAVAAHPREGFLPPTEFDSLKKIPDLLLKIAEKLDKDWPADEIDLQRLAAALETFGLDRPLRVLGKIYGESNIVPIQELAHRIYERGSALHHERLSQAKSYHDLSDAVADTVRQFQRWGLQKKSPELGSRFYPPPRIEIDSALTPFRNFDTEVQELEGFWIIESPPYSIQVNRGRNGLPTGMVEVYRHEGRRPKILYVDLVRDEIEKSNSEVVPNVSSGIVVDDSEIGAKVKLRNKKGASEITLYLPPWLDGVKIELPRVRK
jgi:hypothetical protein